MKEKFVDKVGKNKKQAIAVAISHNGDEDFLAKKFSKLLISLPLLMLLFLMIRSCVLRFPMMLLKIKMLKIMLHLKLVFSVYSTPEDVNNFNNWYYARVAKKSTKPKHKNLKETRDVYKYLCKSEMESRRSEGFVFGGESSLYMPDIGHCKSCSYAVTKTKADSEARDHVAMDNNVGSLYDKLSSCTAGYDDEEH